MFLSLYICVCVCVSVRVCMCLSLHVCFKNVEGCTKVDSKAFICGSIQMHTHGKACVGHVVLRWPG